MKKKAVKKKSAKKNFAKDKKEDKMKKLINNLKAQTWSIDIVIGVVLFLIILVVVYTLVATSSLGDLELRRDAENVYSKFDGSKGTHDGVPAIFSGNVISEEGIEDLLGEDYGSLKAALGIEGDFCIVITYTHGGIHELHGGKNSYGNPADGVLISTGIFCGT